MAIDIINFTYLGQVGFAIKSGNSVIAVDPYLSDYVDKNCCSDDVLWERLYPAPCTGKDLSFLAFWLKYASGAPQK